MRVRRTDEKEGKECRGEETRQGTVVEDIFRARVLWNRVPDKGSLRFTFVV